MSGSEPNPTFIDGVISALDGYGLKMRPGSNTFRCKRSPYGGPESDSFAFRGVFDRNSYGGGGWIDSVRDVRGSVRDLAIHLGIDVGDYVPMGTHSTKKVYANKAEYEREQGAPGAYTKAGWYETVLYGRHALAVPTRTGERHRFLDGDEPRWMSPKGYTPCWYGLERAIQIALATGRPLVICNGESSTVAAQHWNVAATSIAGGSEKSIPTNLLEELRAAWNGSVLVAVDTDSTGRRAAGDLLDSLFSVGYTDAYAVNLGGDKGFDLGKFCKLYGDDAADTLILLPDLFAPKFRLSADPAALRAKDDEIARLRRTISELETQLSLVKDRERWRNDVIKKTDIKPGLRLTLDSLAKELARVPLEEREADQPIAVSYTRMGKETGQSPSTISRHIRKIEDAGFIDVDITRHFDVETESWIAQPVVTPKVDLTEIDKLVIPSGWGGKRVSCPECGGTNVVEKVQRWCKDCEAAIGDEREVILNPEPPVEMVDVLDDTTGELIATPKAEAQPTDCKMLDISTSSINTSSVLQGSNTQQLALRDQPEPPPLLVFPGYVPPLPVPRQGQGSTP
jgi:DNA-binding transcriptional ArsR family regulator